MTSADTNTTATFHVPDMTCGHCEKTIRAAFDKSMPGATLTIDLAAHRVAVGGEAERARAILQDAGYTPNLLS